MDNAIGKLGAYCPEIGDLVSRENGVRFAVITKGNSQPCRAENYPLTQFILHSHVVGIGGSGSFIYELIRNKNIDKYSFDGVPAPAIYLTYTLCEIVPFIELFEFLFSLCLFHDL